MGADLPDPVVAPMLDVHRCNAMWAHAKTLFNQGWMPIATCQD